MVVGDDEQDRCTIDAGECQRLVEVALRRRALADIAKRDLVVVLVGRRHRPADGVAEAATDIARERVEAVVARRIKNGQLAALQRILRVRIDLVDHVGDRILPRDQPALDAVGGETHVAWPQHHGLCNADRLLAGRFHEEAGLALSVRTE